MGSGMRKKDQLARDRRSMRQFQRGRIALGRAARNPLEASALGLLRPSHLPTSGLY